jgi:MFS family permease
MSSITADGPSAPSVDPAGDIGPLEQQHLQYANYRAVAGGTEVTRTHWHVAIANALGWGFDGMDGVIFALVSPMVIKEFSLSLWPAHAAGRQHRAVLAFDAGRGAVADIYGFRDRALAALLRAQWRMVARLDAGGRDLASAAARTGDQRDTIGLVPGASLAGGITGLVAANFGWRIAVMVPGVIALLAIYVRARCPESPYWVQAQDRKRRIAETLARGGTVSDDDGAWFGKAKSVGIRQVFLPDVLPATLVALFVACASTCIYGTVGAWMPLYLATEKHWSTTEYSLFYVFYGICGFLGLCVVGWLIDRIGRRRTFILTLIEGAIFMTLWVYSESHVLLWTFGLAWSLGFLGLWGPSTTLTAEVFPTRIRGAANGVVWAIAYFVGFVLFPFVTIALQQHTGSFALSFLCIPVLMVAMAIGVTLIVPEHTGKELNEIIV